MLSAFDINKLNLLLKDYYQFTHIRITIFDDAFHEITSYPEKIAPVCQYIRTNPTAASNCHACDIFACKKAKNRRDPYVYQCHAGLTEAVSSVRLGNLIVAYLLIGHQFSYPSHSDGWETVRKSCGPYNLNEETLKNLVSQMNSVSEDHIRSAARIMQAVASGLCIDRFITLRQQDLPSAIDQYLTEHFTENIDTETLCEKFHIGKTNLYKIAQQSYGKGIAQQIRQMRIEQAKKLLADNQELSLIEISEKCGFEDYNYFITVFKKHTGVSPGKYRKLSI